MASDPELKPSGDASAKPATVVPDKASALIEGATTSGAEAASASAGLGSGTYEILRQRLRGYAATVRERVDRLDARRREVFGSIEYKLLQSDRVTTAHNCVPQDMVQLGEGRFLFGFNVQFGMRRDVGVEDVFCIYERHEDGTFREAVSDLISDKAFVTDFKRLYNVYEKTVFSKFSWNESNLFMVFHIGAGKNDLAVFKWAWDGTRLRYVNGRSESEFRTLGFPAAHSFRWQTPGRDAFRYGDHPHVSIEDRVFVECVGGDLTIKIEDNTSTGEGLHAEPVDDRHQKVDDAEVSYGIVGHLILLRIRPYKERSPRYFIYNEMLETVDRVDGIGSSCVQLPEDHGLIFPNGYYLGTGELKLFPADDPDLVFERVIHAPNGEDSLFVFYGVTSAQYVMMPYRLIAQRVEERIRCHGFSLFPNGHLLLFRAEDVPRKHHLIQLRQTPFHEPGFEPPGRKDAFLYQVGNKDVVRCLSECNELLTLCAKEPPYSELYVDLARRCGAVLDSHPWLANPEGLGVDVAVRELRTVAEQAVDEFDKVRQLQREAARRLTEMRKKSADQLNALRRARFNDLADHVSSLDQLRRLRGELIALKDVRHMDVAQVVALETSVAEQLEVLAKRCVAFLMEPASLDLYRARAKELNRLVEGIDRVAGGKKLEEEAAELGGRLEMLIEIVHGLKIEDATETTRIIDAITAIFTTLNQARTRIRQRVRSLEQSEGSARFHAQMKLLGQSAASWLDLCDTPAKCDEYLNRARVQIEELEGAFAEVDEFIEILTERRTSLYEAFEQKKLALVDQRNRRAMTWLNSAERILKVIQNRLAGFGKLEEIHSHVASDPMVERIRELVRHLQDIGETVKADALLGQLKSIQQDAIRQLKDREELFTSGPGIIQLGRHGFYVNTQPLDLTIILKDEQPCLHLTSTRYFEPVTDPGYLATRAAWDQELVSETADVYRSEFLAYSIWQNALKRQEERKSGKAVDVVREGKSEGRGDGKGGGEGDAKVANGTKGVSGSMVETLRGASADGLLECVREHMSSRYHEGYTKGVHDLDAAQILGAFIRSHDALGLARFHPESRACALVYWFGFCPKELRDRWGATLTGFGSKNRLFPGDPMQRVYVGRLRELLMEFTRETGLFPKERVDTAGEYLFEELIGDESFVISHEADHLSEAFHQHVVLKGHEQDLVKARAALAGHPTAEYELLRDWVRGFLLDKPGEAEFLDETSALVFCGDRLKRSVVKLPARTILDGLHGDHPRIKDRAYAFDYLSSCERLGHHAREVVPRYEAHHALKQRLLDQERAGLRLESFQPHVLTSFVRNQLIDRVYLPLIGDNLAKQMGAAGEKKRTDLMGLLLLLSPPGYGKTTLVEYVAQRLGLVFVKINGPALGHDVRSLDPMEAGNASAREEIERLNLALEMGDNILLYIDDIQHCHAEFLQKFISLCDAQRKIEGVWRGRPRSHDLRGRKFVVVMAGNPYTESGTRFRLPDMLANRADTYNLGDIIGGNADSFKASYLENALTSNASLAPLAGRSRDDVRKFIQMATDGTRDATGLEGGYSSRDVEEILKVLGHLVRIQEVVLRVNQEYIHSAAQADEYRTEPPFRLQGSYRNMNRLAEKVVPLMNDAEVQSLILDHYRSESQTLTNGAESNFLRFKEMVDIATETERERLEDIRRTFRRNQLSRGADASDPVSRLIGPLTGFGVGLEGIQRTLEEHLERIPEVKEAASESSDPTKGTTAEPVRVEVDFAALAPAMEAIRALAEKYESGPMRVGLVPVESKATAPVMGPDVLNVVLGRLQEIGDFVGKGLQQVVTAGMRDQLQALGREVEVLHETLAGVRDAARKQRDYLGGVQELLATRARQGTVEIEVTEEMLKNEREFLDHFQELLAKARPEDAGNKGGADDEGGSLDNTGKAKEKST